MVSTMPVATSPMLAVSPGCPFMAGNKPQPCTTIQWANLSTRVLVMGQPLLLQAPPGPGQGGGGCLSGTIPNGPPIVKAMQARVAAI
jgi:hypothetical protein